MLITIQTGAAFADAPPVRAAGPAHHRSPVTPRRRVAPDDSRLPPGATRLPAENVEGVVLLHAGLQGAGHDTSGWFVLDSGSGYLGLDVPVARRLGITDRTGPVQGVELADGLVRRMTLGNLEIDAVSPVLLLDAEVIRRVTGRDVLGLVGAEVFTDRALWIDYDAGTVTIVPAPPATPARANPDSESTTRIIRVVTRDEIVRRSRAVLGALIGHDARPVSFRMAGDNKMLVRARFSSSSDPPTSGKATPPVSTLTDSTTATADGAEWVTLVFDTGATKTVLFDPEFSKRVPAVRRWRSVRGLIAPTLVGNAAARLTLAPAIELEAADGGAPIRTTRTDCAEVETQLSSALTQAIGEPVVGLLGYSFVRGYNVGIDYTNQVLWLDPRPHGGDADPYEYSHVGIQIERDAEAILVVGVAEGSPADRAGIRVGDEIRAIGHQEVRASSLLALTQALEGPPGTKLRLRVRRGGVERTYVLSRERLL